MRAAIYVRVSTEEQCRHGFSLEEQKRSCRNRAEAFGALYVSEYIDKGISGATLDRPELKKLREAVRNKEIDIIIARDPDRLSRKLVHQLLLTGEFEKYNVKLEFLDFSWQDTPEGRLFYSIRGAIAEFEREKIRDRMIHGKDQKACTGGIPMGFYAYGYRHDMKTKSIRIDKQESRVVREIFDLFVSSDTGINTIANYLNEKSVPTKKGRKTWHRQVVRQILKNPVYKGEWHYKNVIIPVPAIVDRKTWDRASVKLMKARRLWAGKSRENYLLSGLITCSDCGNTMTGYSYRKGNQKERRYTCRKNCQGTKNPGCRSQKAVPAFIIEKNTWDFVCSSFQSPEKIINEINNLIFSNDELYRQLERSREKTGQIRKSYENLLDAITMGLVDLDEDVQVRLDILKKQKYNEDLARSEIIRKMETAKKHLDINQIQGCIKDFEFMDFTAKKTLVRALVDRVSISKKGGDYLRIDIEAKIPAIGRR